MGDAGDGPRGDGDRPRGFKITDRRSLSADGEPKDARERADAGVQVEAGGAGTPKAATTEGRRAPREAEPTADLGGVGGGPVDFSSFILSLATSAAMSLGNEGGGLGKSPGAPEPPDLPLAAQTIDILAMLGEKTAGNLDEREQALLDSILYDLRIRYATTAKRA